MRACSTYAQFHQKGILHVRLLDNILSSIFLAILSVPPHAGTVVMQVVYFRTKANSW